MIVQRYDPFEGALGISLATRTGPFVFVSGTVGVGPDGVIPSDPAEQFRLVFTNIQGILIEMGTSFENVVDMTSFFCGDFESLYPIFQEVRREFLGGHLPASASIAVAQLVSPDLYVEVKMTAVVPESP
jgi:enamine deaminase RidA (YjgF/YER057c/UK114 family)